MRRVLGIAAICFALSCGDDAEGAVGDDAPATRLSGHWVLMDPSAACLIGFSFREDGLIEFKEVCELTDGSWGIVLDAGWFDATDDSFTWSVDESSCAYPFGARTATVRYALNGDRLTLWVPEGVLVLKRAEDDAGEGTGFFEFGCFDEDGRFEPRAVQPI